MAPRGPGVARLLPSSTFSTNQYLLTKALQGRSPLSPPLFIFHDVIRARSEMSRSLQGKYLSECHRESRGGETTFLLGSVFHCQDCGEPTLRLRVISLPAAVSQTPLFLPCFLSSYWRGGLGFNGNGGLELMEDL